MSPNERKDSTLEALVREELRGNVPDSDEDALVPFLASAYAQAIMRMDGADDESEDLGAIVGAFVEGWNVGRARQVQTEK